MSLAVVVVVAVAGGFVQIKVVAAVVVVECVVVLKLVLVDVVELFKREKKFELEYFSKKN